MWWFKINWLKDNLAGITKSAILMIGSVPRAPLIASSTPASGRHMEEGGEG